MAATRRVGLAACALVGAGAWGVGVFGAASAVAVVLCGVAALFAGALAWRIPGRAARGIAVACLLGLPGVVGLRLAREGRASHRVAFSGWGQKFLYDLVLPVASTAEARPDVFIERHLALTVYLDRNGYLVAHGKQVDLAGLPGLVREVAGNPWPVVLRIDRFAPWRMVEWVLAEVRAGGRKKVLLAAHVGPTIYTHFEEQPLDLERVPGFRTEEARPFASLLPFSTDWFQPPRPGEPVLQIRGERRIRRSYGSGEVEMPSLIRWEAAGSPMDDLARVAPWMKKQPSVAIQVSPDMPYFEVVATIDLARREGKDYTFAKVLKPAPESVRTQSPLPFPKGS